MPEHADRPARVRVTSPRTGVRRAPVGRSPGAEIDDQTEIGDVYLGSLLRAQLRLALGILTALALTVGLLPIAFWVAPDFFARPVLGMPLSWVLLGFAVYPWLVLLAWRYVVVAERNEQDFSDVVERP